MAIESDQQARQQAAKQYVDSLPQDAVQEISPLASIERQLHTGTDAFGERITLEARRVLEHTRDYL